MKLCAHFHGPRGMNQNDFVDHTAFNTTELNYYFLNTDTKRGSLEVIA